MLDHIGLRTNRLKEMFAFYEAVLAPLGYSKQKGFGVAAGFGKEGELPLWIGEGSGAVGDDLGEVRDGPAPDLRRRDPRAREGLRRQRRPAGLAQLRLRGAPGVPRPTAVGVALERFARVVAWLEDLDNDPGTTEDELEEALVKWVVRLKATPGEERIRLLADAAAYLGGDSDDIGAADALETFLRAYLASAKRSTKGYTELTVAADRAWCDRAGVDVVDLPINRAFDPLERIAYGAYHGWGAAAVDTAPPELAPVARRTCDLIPLLWGARSIGAATRAP